LHSLVPRIWRVCAGSSFLSATNGLPALLGHLETLRKAYHGPGAGAEAAAAYTVPRASLVSTGSQDALSKAFEMVCGPGTPLLVEAPTYSGSLAFLRPLGAALVPVATDDGGLVPASLAAVLGSFERDRPGTPKPRCLYTIPNGSNPTGGSLSEARRREIYAIGARCAWHLRQRSRQ